MATQQGETSAQPESPEGLTMADLPEVLNALSPAAYKCYNIGIQLGVSHANICNVQYNCNAYTDWLNNILSYRLAQLPLLKWSDIVQALRSPSVQEYALAASVERMYSTQCVGPISHLNFGPSASQFLLPQQFPYTYQPSYPYMSSLGPIVQHYFYLILHYKFTLYHLSFNQSTPTNITTQCSKIIQIPFQLLNFHQV